MYNQYLIFIFLILLLIFGGIDWLVKKKLNIQYKILYKHVNETHKLVEIILIVVWIAGSGILVLINPAAFKFYFGFAWLTVLSMLRAFMDWKFDKRSRRYISSILAAGFCLIVFLGTAVFSNPVPVRLNADQVEEITIEHHSETITLTDKELIKPILSAIGDGECQAGTLPITPRWEMVITQKSGRKIVIEAGDSTVVFMVHTERILYPRDMMLFSPELELIFKEFSGKRTGSKY